MRAITNLVRVSLVASSVAFAALTLAPSPASAATKAEGLHAMEQGDYGAAMAILRPLAEEGDSDAQNAVGKMTMIGGPGVTRDDARAVEWFLSLIHI